MMKKKVSVEVLLVWMLVPLVSLSLLGRGVLDQLFVGIAPAVILIAAVLLSKTKRPTLFLVAIAALNIWQVWRNFPTNTNVFFQAPQPEVRYSDQLAVIDEVYKRAGSHTFEVQAYTIPYFWQDGWTYLFGWRGKPPVPTGGDLLFVVIQRDDTPFQKNWYRDVVSAWGTLRDQFTIGSYMVEERRLQPMVE